MRKIPFINNNFYHVYNRGVDKREIFLDGVDLARFFQSMVEFNTVEPIGSIYENCFKKENQLGHQMSKLVNFVAYCLNENHYHFILEQVVERGIEKFMQKLGNGYTKYFNNRNDRSGVLFQGVFKAVHIDSNEYLLHVSAYVNLNYRVHSLGHQMSKSSWEEYTDGLVGICNKEVITNQFNDTNEYKNFSESTIMDITERRNKFGDLQRFFIETI